MQDSDAEVMDWLSSTGSSTELANIDALAMLAWNANTTSVSLEHELEPALEQASWWNEIYAIPDGPLYTVATSHAENAPIWEDFADFLVDDNSTLTLVQNNTDASSEQSSSPAPDNSTVAAIEDLVPLSELPQARGDDQKTRKGGTETSRRCFPWSAAMIAAYLVFPTAEENTESEAVGSEVRAPLHVLSPGGGSTPPLDVYNPDDYIHMKRRIPTLQPSERGVWYSPSPSPDPMVPVPEPVLSYGKYERIWANWVQRQTTHSWKDMTVPYKFTCHICPERVFSRRDALQRF